MKFTFSVSLAASTAEGVVRLGVMNTVDTTFDDYFRNFQQIGTTAETIVASGEFALGGNNLLFCRNLGAIAANTISLRVNGVEFALLKPGQFFVTQITDVNPMTALAANAVTPLEVFSLRNSFGGVIPLAVPSSPATPPLGKSHARFTLTGAPGSAFGFLDATYEETITGAGLMENNVALNTIEPMFPASLLVSGTLNGTSFITNPTTDAGLAGLYATNGFTNRFASIAATHGWALVPLNAAGQRYTAGAGVAAHSHATILTRLA